MLACIHTLLVEGRVDEGFVDTYVHGWERFALSSETPMANQNLRLGP